MDVIVKLQESLVKASRSVRAAAYKSFKMQTAIILILLALMYYMENFLRPQIISVNAYIYAVRPLLWAGVACAVLRFPRVRAKGLLRHRRQYNYLALYYGVIFIIVLVLAGLLDGYGKSPFGHSFKWILINTLFVGSELFARELVRNHLVNTLAKGEDYKVFISIALLMAFSSIGFGLFSGIVDFEKAVIFIAESLLPAFSKNLFAVILVYWGGPASGIIYMGVMQAFHWYSPILPDLQWITVALTGTLCPLFCMMLFQRTRMEMAGEIRIRDRDKERPMGWIATSIVAIAIIWFAVGVFPIYPTVIATGSMEPEIMVGDVILVDRRLAGHVQPDDVIQFKKGEVLVSHRVIEIIDQETGKAYRTKGDNNPAADFEPVEAHMVTGKVVFVAPKVGLPTLYIKSRSK